MDLQSKIILLTVFLQVSITLWAIVTAGVVRTRALTSTDLRLRMDALRICRYPDEALKFGNNMQNQFETPILLYAGASIALAVGVASWVMAGAAVAYVLARIWHRWIHVRHNNVRKRFAVFVYGIAAITVFWAALGFEIFRL